MDYDGAFLILDTAEADAMKLLWRPKVRYYLYAAHACLLIDILRPWCGLLLLLALWLARITFFREIKRHPGTKVHRDRDAHDPGSAALSQILPQPLAISLWLLTGGSFFTALAFLIFEPLELAADVYWTSIICFALITWSWSTFFSGIMNHHRKMKKPAQA